MNVLHPENENPMHHLDPSRINYLAVLVAFFIGAVFLAELIFRYLIAAMGLDILIMDSREITLVTGIHVGLICYAIVAAFRMTAHVCGPKPIGAFLIDSGFDFVALPVMGAILATWR
jgi:hypothetical protein